MAKAKQFVVAKNNERSWICVSSDSETVWRNELPDDFKIPGYKLAPDVSFRMAIVERILNGSDTDGPPFFGLDEFAERVTHEGSGLVATPKEQGAEMATKDSEINSPSYYTWHPVCECIRITEHFPANRAALIQYVWRAGRKVSPGQTGRQAAIKDLKKAAWYLRRELQRLEEMEEKERLKKEVIAGSMPVGPEVRKAIDERADISTRSRLQPSDPYADDPYDDTNE